MLDSRKCISFCALLLFSSWAHAIPISVTGTFTGYSGPVGKPIYPGPVAEPAISESFFGTDLGTPFVISPSSPYPGYGSAEFDGAGTGSGTFSGEQIEFWNRFNQDPSTDEAHNLLALTHGAGDINSTGDEFLLGTLTFRNGNWFTNTPYDPGNGQLYPLSVFDVSFVTNSSHPPFDNHVWTDQLIYFSTRFAPANSPEQNADYVSFVGYPELGQFWVYEGGTATVNIIGTIGSLIPLRFDNLVGDGFLIAAVPEPGSVLLLCAGLAGLGLLRYRRSS